MVRGMMKGKDRILKKTDDKLREGNKRVVEEENVKEEEE